MNAAVTEVVIANHGPENAIVGIAIGVAFIAVIGFFVWLLEH